MRPAVPVLVAVCCGLAALPAQAHELTGDWLTDNGERVTVERCGTAYCAVVATGVYAGRRIAKVVGPGPRYRGQIVDPRVGRTYTGSMTVDGEALALQGCLMEVFCKTVQTWRRP